MLIAVVDPSKSFRAVLKSVLSQTPVEWVEFSSVTEARTWLLDHKPDMVITAKELGDGTYLDLLRDIRKRESGEYLPVYLFSSDDSDRLVGEAFARGITDVFEKQHISEIVQLLQKLAFFSDIAQGASILLVEDDPALRLYYARQLQQAGLDVQTAAGSKEALAILHASEMDLVITDLNLQAGELGQDIIRAVRRKRGTLEGQIPILVLTGGSQVQHKTGLFYLGVDDYLVKPVDIRQLIVRAIQLIEKFRIQKQLQAQMESYREKALYDSLTGAHNRYGFIENAASFVERCRRENLSLALLYCDLDNFKSVNDRFGHDTGDAVIQQACDCIRAGLRGQDLLTRWGGDEFVGLLQLNRSDPSYAQEVAETILRRFRVQEPDLHGVGCSIGLSIGSPHSMDALMELVDRADAALYQSKRAGRGRVTLAQASTG